MAAVSASIYTTEFTEAHAAEFEENPVAYLENVILPSISNSRVRNENNIQWERNAQDNLVVSSANGLTWFYIDLLNSSETSREALFEFINIDGVGWAYYDEFGDLQLVLPGYDFYIGGRGVFDTEYVVPVELAASSESQLIGFLYNISSPRVSEVNAWDSETFRAQRSGQFFGDGTYFGFLFALVIYNLVLALIMRQMAYLYAGVFQLCVGAVIFISTGYSTLFLFQNNQIYTVPAYGMLIVLASISSGLFSISILRIKEYNRKLFLAWCALVSWGVIQLPLIALTSIPSGIETNANRILLSLNAIVFLCSLGIHIYTLTYFWRRVSITKYWFVTVTVQIWVVMIWQLVSSMGIGNADSLKYLIQLFTLINGAVLSLLISIAFREEQRGKTQAQEEALTSLQMANDIQLSKANFISTAGHDLRQPLQAIRLHIEALQQHASESTGEVLTKVEHNIQELSALLNSLMNLSKSTSYVDNEGSEEFLLDEVIGSLHEEVEPFAKQKGLKLIVKEAPYLVRTSKVGLAQILRNLLNNAIKFTREGSITIRVDQIGENISVSVIDTGPGIPEHEVNNIFDERYQVPNKLSEKKDGMGIGLSIVKRLSEALDIPLEVDSTVGKGTEFQITLRASTTAVVKRMSNTDPTSLNGLRVAIVHQSDSRRNDLKNTIEQWGAMALAKEDLQSLHDYTQKHAWTPHMMIVEQSLFEEFSKLSERTENSHQQTHSLFLSLNVPTIVLSANEGSSEEVLKKANANNNQENQASRYHWFTDPLSPGVLRSFIQRVVIKPAG